MMDDNGLQDEVYQQFLAHAVNGELPQYLEALSREQTLNGYKPTL